MTLTKTCHSFDSNLEGSLVFIDKTCMICCDRGYKLDDVNDYTNIDIDKIMQKRREFIEGFYNGTHDKCKNCHQLKEVDLDKKELDKISWLNISGFTTCSLRCKYCYFSDKQLGEKLSDDKKYLLPIVKQFHKKGILTDRIALAIAGGEPLLFEDIPETIDFLCKNYKEPRINVISNSTITSKVEKIAETMKNAKMKWKNLYTSMDAGTRETYKKIRGGDFFDAFCKNIMTYAKNNCFTDMQLKYILLNNKEKDMYNLSDEDINGYCEFVKQVKNSTNTNISMVLDIDFFTRKLDDEMKKAAIKIVKYAVKNNIAYSFSPCGYITQEDIEYINQEAVEEKCNINILCGENNSIVAPQPVNDIEANINIQGSNNIIRLGKIRGRSKEYSRLNINIRANNSLIDIGDSFIEKSLDIQCGRSWGSQSDNIEIKIDSPCTIKDVKIFACNKNSKIHIEKHCMFDSNIYIANADEHPIYDRDTKEIINKGNILKIGLHSWIKDNVSILKNVQLMDNTMVETASVVFKSFKENRCLIAGNPAEIIKRNVDWSKDNEEFLN